MPILTPTAEFDELASTLPEDIFTQERMNEFVRGVFRSAGSNTVYGYKRFSPYPLSKTAVDSLKSMWVERKMEERIYSFDESRTPERYGKSKNKPFTKKEIKKFQARYMALAKGSEVYMSSIDYLLNKKLSSTVGKTYEAKLSGKEHKKDAYATHTFQNMMSSSTYKQLMNYGSFTKWTVRDGISPKTGNYKHRTVYEMNTIDTDYLGDWRNIYVGDGNYRRVSSFEIASRAEEYSRWHDWLNVYGNQSLNDSRTQEAIIRYMDKKLDAMVEEANRI